MTAALAICRFAHYGAVMLLLGTSAFLWALVPPPLARDMNVWMRPLRLAAPALLVTSGAWLALEAGGMGEGWRDVIDPATWSAVLFDTAFGHVWIVETSLALVLNVILLRSGRIASGMVVLVSGLLAATLGLVGHAAMREGAAGLLSRITMAVHLLAGAAWLGALPPLLAILRRLDEPDRRRDAVTALRRFSITGHGAVALVIATGVVNTALTLGRWPVDPASPYQALLDIKIALVALMTALAIINRYALVPKLRDGPAALAALKRNTRGEIALGGLVLALVSLFGLLDPG